MSRNILIAVDGSDNSIYAVDWSVGNFLRPGDRVFLIYVFPEYVEISQDGDGLCVAIDGVTDKTRQVPACHCSLLAIYISAHVDLP